jgi:hypothetical protein
VNASFLILAVALGADAGISTKAPAIDLGQTNLGLKAPSDGGVATPAPDGGAPRPTTGLDVSRMFFDKDDILKVVAYHTKEVQDCYEHAIAETEQKFEGRVWMDFVVDADGKVKEAKVRKKGTTLKQERVHDCIIAAAYDWLFPKPPDGKLHPLSFPFDLKFVK